MLKNSSMYVYMSHHNIINHILLVENAVNSPKNTAASGEWKLLLFESKTRFKIEQKHETYLIVISIVSVFFSFSANS